MTLTLSEANSIVKAAIAKAQELNIIVSVAVCDTQGRVVALNRMVGTFAEVDQFAIGKAIASAATGLPSGDVIGFVDHSRVDEVIGEGVPEYRVRGGCQFSGMAKSKGDAALMEPYPARKRKNAPALE